MSSNDYVVSKPFGLGDPKDKKAERIFANSEDALPFDDDYLPFEDDLDLPWNDKTSPVYPVGVLNAPECGPVYAPAEPLLEPALAPTEHSFKRSNNVISNLPDEIREVVSEMAEYFRVYPELIFSGMLTAITTPMMGIFQVGIDQGWKEPLALYTLTVADPSEKKSPVLNVLMKPLKEGIAKYNDRVKDIYRNAVIEKSILEKTYTSIEKKAENDKAKLSELLDIKAKIEDLERLMEKSHALVVSSDDITPEKLGSVLKNNKERLLIASSEGGLFQTMSGIYSNGKSNIDLLLHAFNGESYSQDRISREGIDLKHPLLSQLLYIQPKTLMDVVSNKEFMGRGLIARFLVAVPDSCVGHRDFTEEKPIYDDEPYRALIMRLYETFSVCADRKEASTVIVSKEAKKKLNIFQNEIEGHILDDLSEIKVFCGKIAGITARIAAILHISKIVLNFNASHKDACTDEQISALIEKIVGTEIDAATMDAAIGISSYYIGEAKEVFDPAKHVEYYADELSKDLLAALREEKSYIGYDETKRKHYITARELKRMRRNDKNDNTLWQALDFLIEKGSLIQEDQKYYFTE